MTMYKILIGDENKLFVEGLKCIIREHFTFAHDCLEGNTGPEVMDQFYRTTPDVVLMNVKLPEVDGISLIKEMKKINESVHIIIISEYDQPKFIKIAFQGGADAYLLKSNSLVDFKNCIESVLNGSTYMGEGVSVGPLHRKKAAFYENNWSKEDAFIMKNNLTKREVEILGRIADAKNNKEIAEELYISDQTVSVHRKNIMKKLNVSSTASLIRLAQDYGIIT
jgi:DNA-binding NarL/FixJ family response regulator